MSKTKSFLKTKTVHGVKTGNHSNPNVLRAARASGGSCMVEGGSARPSMGKAPRMMRADGGSVLDFLPGTAAGAGAALAKKFSNKPAAPKDGAKEMPPSNDFGSDEKLEKGGETLRKITPDQNQIRLKTGGGVMPRFKATKKGC